jgi:hypothetical protein
MGGRASLALRGMVMQELDIHDEIAAFMRDKPKLSIDDSSPWVVFAKGQFQERFSSFEAAYTYAVQNFDAGKFLIRDLNQEKPFIPLMFVKH